MFGILVPRNKKEKFLVRFLRQNGFLIFGSVFGLDASHFQNLGICPNSPGIKRNKNVFENYSSANKMRTLNIYL